MNLVFAFFLMVSVSFPLAVLAQSSGGTVTVPTNSAGWISLLIQTLVVPLIGLIGQALWGFIERRKGHDAIGRILELIDAVGQPIWDKLSMELKAVLADGVIDAAERQRLNAMIAEELERLVSPATLKLAMKALGVPDIGGLTSWLLAKLLARWKGAHDAQDPSIPNAMTGVYPVFQKQQSVGPAGLPPDAPEYGGG